MRRSGRSRAVRLCAAAALMILAVGTAWPASSAGARAPSSYFVRATGHVLSEPFLSHWAARDGLARFGLPVTEPVAIDGRETQFFEFGYLQERAGTDRLVQRKAGIDLLAARHDPGRTVAGRRVGGSRADTAFLRTQASATFAVKGRIEAYYERNGGDDTFGPPQSRSYVVSGKRVQWFEFGRLEWALDDKVVGAASVGFELARATGVDTLPVERGRLPLFDPGRFRTYHGDGTIPEAPGPFSPAQIMIPKIAIDAKIERVGIIDGVMDVPKDVWNVGWYPSLAKPGERTNVVLAGHKDWWNVGPVVFWNLDKLSPGDKIYLIGMNGKGYTYVVTKAWQIDADTDAGVVINDTGAESLTLITCGGDFNGAEYLLRQIVRAERI